MNRDSNAMPLFWTQILVRLLWGRCVRGGLSFLIFSIPMQAHTGPFYSILSIRKYHTLGFGWTPTNSPVSATAAASPPPLLPSSTTQWICPTLQEWIISRAICLLWTAHTTAISSKQMSTYTTDCYNARSAMIFCSQRERSLSFWLEVQLWGQASMPFTGRVTTLPLGSSWGPRLLIISITSSGGNRWSEPIFAALQEMPLISFVRGGIN